MLGNELEGTFSVNRLEPTSFFINLYMAPANKTTKITVKTMRKESPKYFLMLPGMLKALQCTVFTNFFGLGHFTLAHSTCYKY